MRATDRGDSPSFIRPSTKFFEVAAVEALNGLFDARGEFSKPLEIAAVAFKGVIGEAAFDPQVRQIRVDEIVGG